MYYLTLYFNTEFQVIAYEISHTDIVLLYTNIICYICNLTADRLTKNMTEIHIEIRHT